MYGPKQQQDVENWSTCLEFFHLTITLFASHAHGHEFTYALLSCWCVSSIKSEMVFLDLTGKELVGLEVPLN